MKICSWRFFLEDLFLEIFPLKFWKFLLKICSLEIFPLEYGFGDFSFWRIVRGDFSLKIYFGDFSIEFLKIFKKICSWRFFLLKICSWRFFLEDLFLEIFPLKFWKFLLKICSLEIFPFENGDFFFYDHKVKKMKMD